MKKILFLLLCSFLFSGLTPTYAQSWSENQVRMIPLHSGGFYLVGRVSGEMDFFNGISAGSGGGCVVYLSHFLARIDSAGNPLWARSFSPESWGGDTGWEPFLCLNIAVDSTDNIYLSGQTLDNFYWNMDETPLLPISPYYYAFQAFAAKITPAGVPDWVVSLPQRYPGSLGGIAVGNGQVYVATSTTTDDSLVVFRADAATGALQQTAYAWSAVATGDSLLRRKVIPYAIAADAQGNCYLAGECGPQLLMDTVVLANTAPVADQTAFLADRVPFLLKLSPGLAPLFSVLPAADTTPAAGPGSASWRQIAVSGGQMWTTGAISGARPLYLGQDTLTTKGNPRAHLTVAAFDTLGNAQWASTSTQAASVRLLGYRLSHDLLTGEAVLLAVPEDGYSIDDSIQLAPLGWWQGHDQYGLIARLEATGAARCIAPANQHQYQDVAFAANHVAYSLSVVGYGSWYLSRWDSCGSLVPTHIAEFSANWGAITPSQTAGFTLSPNPASDHVEIRLAKPAHGPQTANLYTVQGQCIWQGQLEAASGETYRLPLGDLLPGLYLLTIPGYGTGRLMVVR